MDYFFFRNLFKRTSCLSVILALLVSPAVLAQNFITVKGDVLDAETKEPLSYATVSLAKFPIGVVTGQKGEFTFYVPAKNATDTLVISMLGYEQYKLPVKIADRHSSFLLNPKPMELAEVTVTGISAKEIVRKAFKKVSKNYPSKPYLFSAHLQEFIREGSLYVRAFEAAVTIHNDSYRDLNQTYSIDSIIVSQNRIDKKFWKFSGGDQAWAGSSGFNVFLTQGGIDNKATYLLEKVVYQGDSKVFIVTCEGINYKHTYHIDASSYAFTFVDHIMTTQDIDDGDPKKIRLDMLEFKQSIMFSKIDGLYYPFLISKQKTGQHRQGLVPLYTKTTITQMLVTSIKPDAGASPFKRKTQFTAQDAYFTKTPKMKKWKHFNALPNSEVRQEALRQLEVENL